MFIKEFIFYIYSILLIILTFMVLFQNNPIYCVLFLALNFLSISLLWLLKNAEFLFFVFILVYVGAIITLFLFVTMMIGSSSNIGSNHSFSILDFILFFAISFIMIALFILVLPKCLLLNSSNQNFNKIDLSFLSLFNHKVINKYDSIVHTREVGTILYSNYIFPFELIALILLVSIISVIVLSKVRNK
ncbi:NADH-quinone oxidoreductase subunit J [Candidatus Legionella polyplacis]|uniref:NADH-quinone oxidoreductase subunit J n=1 Tax=Candidatus Legionella polyplacis TaxID=2005262 RepID=UPI0011AB7D6F|nr:NADH-quinone oxidoreductase subunit J [Candidatus Legionella polyplacis]